VPYRGSVPGVTDVVGGQIACMITPHGDFIANHKAGKMRIIATSGKKRSPFVPDVATFAEQGWPELTVEEWFGFYAPKGTPAKAVAFAIEKFGRIDVLVNAAGSTARGGIVAAIARERPKPVRFIGVGEGLDDLRPFEAGEFVAALFD